MKKIFLSTLIFFSHLLSYAQDKKSDYWKLTWNKKPILQTSTSDETANTLKIKAADLKKSYMLELTYKEADAAKGKSWIRSFMLLDESGNELWRKDSTHLLKITAAELKKLFAGKKQLKIYTIAIPSDPDLAARVRVRRVHLCTLKLQ
jgi:hypothetical protein